MSFEDLLKTLQKDYLASLPEKVLKIRAQIAATSAGDLRESFHKLKGTGRTYGLPEVSELAEVVENVCLTYPGEAPGAASLAVSILEDIHSAHTHSLQFNLHQDPRFAQIRKLIPA